MIYIPNLEQITLNPEKIPEKYKISSSPNESLTVYRGDSTGLQKEGIFSKTYKSQDYDKIILAKRIIENGDELEIQKLIDSHTGSSTGSRLFPNGSPFVSASLNPEIAQVFATKRNETIYRIEISPYRAIADYDLQGRFGIGQEVLIMGFVTLDEISAVKIKNDRSCSELVEDNWNGIEGLKVIKYFPELGSLTREVKQPENWRVLV